MMQILNFHVNLADVNTGLAELADNIKILVYQENEDLINKIGFENDTAFLEPNLFYYFRKKVLNEAPLVCISQIMSGYGNENLVLFDAYSDETGVCYIPNLGYSVFNEKNKLHKSTKLNQAKRALENGKVTPINPLTRTQDGSFYACYHKPQLFDDLAITLNENLFSSTSKMLPFCNEALNIIQEITPEYHELVKLTTREFVLFNASNTESFAAMHHFGTAFLNSYSTTPSIVSMVEDIAHQCAHTLFYTLTHDSQRHLKVPKDTPVKNFNGRDNESRDVFGAFHGNFTFAAIFHCFDKLFQSKILRGDDKLELMARMGIGLRKFSVGIKDFEDVNTLLTKEGAIFHQQFIESFECVRDKYWQEVAHFDYSNQGYSFNFEKFKEIN
jgi:hypothetical protein